MEDMDQNVQSELKTLRKRLYLYHNELLEIERQSKICRCRHAYEEISKKPRYSDEDEETDAFITSYIPLQNEYILEMIANYLPNQDVKNCRAVCRLWAKEMGRNLASRKSLIVTEDDCPEAKRILLKNKGNKHVVCVSNLCFFDVRYTSTLYKQLLSAFGWTLSGLKLEECKISANELADVLIRKAPHLESFSYKDRAPIVGEEISTFYKIRSSNGNTNEEFVFPEMKRLHWDEEFGRVRLEEIISACPNLIELIYKNTPVPHPPDFHNASWNSLRTLKLSPRDEMRQEHFASFAALNLKLRRLSLCGINPKLKSRMDALKTFLQTISSTLEELELFQHYTIEMMPYDERYESPFPIQLPLLKRLNLDFSILRSLKAIDSLKKLKTLECKSNNFLDWQIVLKLGVPRKHKIIKHLNLGSIDQECLLKLSKCFPTLTNLELDAVKIDDEALRTIIKNAPQLKQLKLCKVPLSPLMLLTDSGITGLSPEFCQKIKTKTRTIRQTDFVTQKKFPGIQDLKDLYRLELGADESSLSDISILNGITKCSKLLILSIPSCQITDASLKAIEQRLPGLTMLELSKCENVTEQAITALKANRKDLILQ